MCVLTYSVLDISMCYNILCARYKYVLTYSVVDIHVSSTDYRTFPVVDLQVCVGYSNFLSFIYDYTLSFAK